MIKHLVLSGGGPAGLLTYGTLCELHKQSYWKLSDIISVHGCSIGAFMGLVISLDYNWDVLDDYFIKRPWDKVAKLNSDNIIQAFSSIGLYDNEIIDTALEPLLTAKGLSCKTTLKELYEFTGIDLVIYTTNLNTSSLDAISLSHDSHPTLPISTAIAMSMAVPVLFKPIFYDGGCYIDGDKARPAPCLVFGSSDRY